MDINPYRAIENSLPTEYIGRRIIYYPRVTSTMDAARRQARLGAAAGTVVIAGRQTGGRGRLRRTWLSPEGNIALSVILYPDIALLTYLIMVASLAVVYAVEAVAGLEPQIKWPNDVLISGKKVCGILVESDIKKGGAACAIVGIGINVGLRSSDYKEISATATSLNAESGRQVSRLQIVRHLLTEFERLYLSLPDGEPVYELWRDRLVTLGKKVYFESADGMVEGIAESVERSGALVLRLADGGTTAVVAGDVLLRER